MKRRSASKLTSVFFFPQVRQYIKFTRWHQFKKTPQPRFLGRVHCDGLGDGDIISTFWDVALDGWSIFLQVYLCFQSSCFSEHLCTKRSLEAQMQHHWATPRSSKLWVWTIFPLVYRLGPSVWWCGSLGQLMWGNRRDLSAPREFVYTQLQDVISPCWYGTMLLRVSRQFCVVKITCDHI